MIWLLVATSAIVVLDSDRRSFEDYRQCALSEVNKAATTLSFDEIMQAARNICELEYAAAAMEMAADAFEAKRTGSLDERLAVLQSELTKEALEQWKAQTTKS